MSIRGSTLGGIAWMVLATALFVALDTIAKYLTAIYPVEQVVWARFTFHLAFVACVLAPRGLPTFRSKRPGLQLLRSCFMLGANACFFLAIRTMALVEATAIVFCGPLFVTLLSIPLLGERVGLRRMSAVVIGFVGALVIIRPGTDILQTVAVLPLLAALSFALYQILTRKLAPYDPPLTTLFYTSVAGTVGSCVLVPSVWVEPDMQGWVLMAGAGLFGALGQLALIKAIQLAPVSVVAPFNYLGLVWASAFGFIFFADVPDGPTIIGALIIAASGLYVLRREQLATGQGSQS